MYEQQLAYVSQLLLTALCCGVVAFVHDVLLPSAAPSLASQDPIAPAFYNLFAAYVAKSLFELLLALQRARAPAAGGGSSPTSSGSTTGSG